MNVPFVDLKAQYQQIKGEVQTALTTVMENTAFVLGPAVADFEQAFAAHHEAKHCVAVSSGTSALHAAMLAAGVAPGDEVIVPANTFIATAEAVSHCGGVPVYVDVSMADYNIDPQQIEAAITPKTKAIAPVHLYGQPAELNEVLAIADKHSLIVIEDCAQAHNAEYKGQKVGTFGVASAFSFYPGKNLGAYGEGGAVLTNDDELADKVRMLRDHGSMTKYEHDVVGYNYRMHGFQGAVLGVKLKYLVAWTDQRRRAAATYRDSLADLPLELPPEKDYVRHVYHLFVVRIRGRQKVMDALSDKGVASGIHYPVPLHLTGAYRSAAQVEGTLPIAEQLGGEIMSLPMYPELTDDMIDYVAQCLKEIL